MKFDSKSLQDLRSEEHTSELQSRSDLVCRLLLEKKKQKDTLLIDDITKSTTTQVSWKSHTPYSDT